ncbi:MAG: hypothetical protein H6736_08295 [Alphaproteobacteria bacterium]|nr:hypothetical protein [Alphaproteobacteria bacterium]
MAGGKRPRLFAFSREIELSTVEGWATPAERPLLEEAIDAFLDVTRTRQLTNERLEPIVAACRHASPNVRTVGVARLVVMAHYFEHARDAYRDLALAEDAGVRETACGSLPNAPDELWLPSLEIYLADEEPTVRQAAARVAATQVDPGLVTVLERALARETDPFTLKLLGRAHAVQSSP